MDIMSRATSPATHDFERFHIHVDGTIVPPAYDQMLREELGFVLTNFTGHPDGYSHFEPNQHYTWKTGQAQSFKRTWQQLIACTRTARFVGYLEGEYVHTRSVIAGRPYDPKVPFPFRVERRRLSEERGERFREAELHLTLDKDHSHPDLIRVLLQAGLYGAYLPRTQHTALVLTMQGYEHDIHRASEMLRLWLERVGGTVHAVFKEERAIRSALFGISVEQLPEIADHIIWMP